MQIVDKCFGLFRVDRLVFVCRPGEAKKVRDVLDEFVQDSRKDRISVDSVCDYLKTSKKKKGGG